MAVFMGPQQLLSSYKHNGAQEKGLVSGPRRHDAKVAQTNRQGCEHTSSCFDILFIRL